MKLIAFVALLLLPAFITSAADFDLGTNGVISVTIPEKWIVTGKPLGPVEKPMGFTLDIKPASNATVHSLVTFVYGTPPKMDVAQLHNRVLQVGEKFVADSVEKKKNLKDFKLKDGLGAYCVFTDASLVGKKPGPGDYKIMGSGMLQFSNGLLGAVSIFADDSNGKEFNGMLDSINSLKLKSNGTK